MSAIGETLKRHEEYMRKRYSQENLERRVTRRNAKEPEPVDPEILEAQALKAHCQALEAALVRMVPRRYRLTGSTDGQQAWVTGLTDLLKNQKLACANDLQAIALCAHVALGAKWITADDYATLDFTRPVCLEAVAMRTKEAVEAQEWDKELADLLKTAAANTPGGGVIALDMWNVGLNDTFTRYSEQSLFAFRAALKHAGLL